MLRVLIASAVLAAIWGALAARDLWTVRGAARAAIRHAEASVSAAERGDLDAARSALDMAANQLEKARRSLSRPWIRPIRWVPFAGTELGAARAGLTAADEMSAAGIEIMDFITGPRPPLLTGSRLNVEALSMMDRVLAGAIVHADEARRVLDDAPRPRIGAIRSRLDEIDDASRKVHDAVAGAAAFVDRLLEAGTGGDPYRILVLFENGAELRATGGLMGFVSLFEVDDGRIIVRRAEVVHDLRTLDHDGNYLSVPAPADYIDRYGQFDANTTLWLNINLSPDFPTVAEVARRLYVLSAGIEPDAVARIDLVGVGYLLDVFKEVTIEDERIDGHELATDFLIDSYLRFRDQEDQSAYLARVVTDVFDQLLAGVDADRDELLKAARRLTTEHRAAVFTGDDRIDRALGVVGADGALSPGDPGEVHVAVQNFAANKIDLFTHTDLSFDVRPNGCVTVNELTLSLTNGVPDGLEGLPGPKGNGGTWWTSFYLPRDAVLLGLSLDGSDAKGSFQVEAGRPVASLIMQATEGDTVTAAVRWEEVVSGPEYLLRVQPQPRIVPATMAVGDGPRREFVESETFRLEADC